MKNFNPILYFTIYTAFLKKNYVKVLSGALLLIAAMPRLLFAQAPTLSYSSPQTYLPNTSITPLAPQSTNVGTPSYSSSASIFNTGISTPFGVATDAPGNLYVSDITNQIVKQFPAGGGSPVIIGSGQFSHPQGIAIDASGNVYAADSNYGLVREVLKSDGSGLSLGTGFNELSGVAVDAVGNVFVADFGNSNPVKKILKSNGSTISIGTGFGNYPSQVAVDAAGNVYVADANLGVKEILASNGNTIDLGSGFSQVQGVAVDAVGNVFVADAGNHAIKEILVGNSTPITLVSGLTNPGQITVDPKGNIFFVDTTNGTVQEISPVGGYYISPTLPAGLNFNQSTGIISGTTPGINSSANYLVTAYNSSGNVSATLNVTVGTPPAPTLSYSSPVTYTTGRTINPLIPQSTAVSPPAHSSVSSIIGTGYNSDQGVATDAAGNVYVTDFYNQAIKKIPAGGGNQVTVTTGLSGPIGIAVDPAGAFAYVAENTSSDIKKVPLAGGSPVIIGSGFNGPTGVAVDASGNVYVADYLNSAIKKISVTDGSTTIYGSGFNYPFGVAVDAAGNVYVADTYNNQVKEISAGNGSISVLGSGFNTPQGVAVDAVGNVYVADFGNKAIKMIPAGGGSTITIASGLPYPIDVAVDGTGNILAADPGADAVFKFKPTGGYYLNTALPTGLVFNGTSGVISGTPAIISSAKNYTVTAYNIGGSAQASLNLTVIAPTTITSITPHQPSPTNAYYTQFDVVFAAPVTGLTPSNFSLTTSGLTGTSVNSVIGSGTTYSVTALSGSGDGTLTLNLANDLGLEPGISTKLPFAGQSYTIDKTPPTYIAGTGSFTSNNAVSNHEAKIGNLVTLTFTATEKIQTPSISISGHNVTPTNTSGNTWTANYTMTSTDAPGIIAFSVTLIDLAGNSNTISSASVNSDLVFNTTTPKAISGDFTSNNPNDKHSAKIGDIVSLNFVTNEPIQTPTITIAGHSVIPANSLSDGITWSAGYKLTSSDVAGNVPFSLNFADLAGNTISGGTPITDVTTNSNLVFYKNPPSVTIGNPSATSATTGPVTYSVTYGTTAIFSKALSPSDITLNKTGTANGAVQVTGIGPGFTVSVSTLSGAGTLGISIKAGTATDKAGNTATAAGPSATFTVVSSNANLANLTVSSGPLTPAFASTTTSYSQTVGNATSSTTVTPTVSYSAATVKVNGTTVVSGAPLSNIPLSTGSNTITVTVTAQDGITTKTYTVTINRLSSGSGPIFSYSSPKVYTANTVIPTLSPVLSNSVNSLAYNKPVKFNTGGLSSPFSCALDAAGNVYVADQGNNSVFKIPAGGGTPVVIGSGFYQPASVAVDGLGNVFVADAGNSAVKKIPAGGGTPVSLGGSYRNPLGIATDAAGNVYVTDYYLNNVTQIPAAGGNPKVIAWGFNHPIGLAVDGLGNIYVADAQNSAIVKLTAGTYAKTVISNYFYFPTGVAIDGAGNIFIADDGINTVYEIPVGAKNPTTFAKNFKSPAGVAVDGIGNIYVAEQGNAAVDKIMPSGGYFINTMLPAGLIFNDKTGAITGTPTLSSPATNYNVTAYNAAGSGAASVNIAVNGAPNFSYNGPQLYYSTWTISPLAPALTGNAATGGFTISPTLPTGLSINSSTGVISGTPTVLSAATTYTITGNNSYGNGTATINITVNAIVAPTIATSGLTFSNTTVNSTHISWANGNGNSRAVFIFLGSNGGPSPVNHTDYTANAAYGAGSQIGSSGWYCVYNGSGSSADITNLTAGTTYRVAAIDYNGTTGSELYLLSGNARGNVTTMPTPLNNIYLPSNSGSTPLIATINNNEKVLANNILSPNGDGVNDIWVVKNIAFYPNNRVTIYDRTGNVIFTRKNYANDWAGTYRGSVLKEGTYFYLIDLGNGHVEKGFITVVRDR